MYSQHMNKGFSLLEILVVIAILSVITTIGSLSYSNVRSRSEDSKRRTDIEEIRSALEQYKSINNTYPTPNTTISPGLPFGTSGLVDGTNTYMEKIPQDPDYPVKTYTYISSGSSDYILKSHLNNPEPTPCNLTPTPDQCGSTFDCNYCYGSYGQK